MQCPKCRAENREGRRFCGQCGAPLAVACAACGYSNQLGEKFCGGCGVPVAASPPEPRFASPQSYTPKHLADAILTSRAAVEGERKQVTVLFADIKGSLALIEDRDPEQVRALLDTAIRPMMAAVHRYEGTVNKVLGDGIMALFGAPLAHEDHAVRACYAALAMHQAIGRAAEETRASHGVEVQIRAGLNSGEVVVRAIGNDLNMDYDAIGQTTHLAGRMEQLAVPGTTRLTADTLRLAEGLIQVRALGPVPVKGLERPVEVFELDGATASRSRFQAAVARGLTRFVGRYDELETLNRALARAAQGRGQVVAVVGEAGIGKSRLCHEFIHSQRTEGWLILESASVSYGKATAYLPGIELLKGYFGIEDRDDVRRVREKVTGKLLTLDEGLKPTLVALLDLLHVPVEDAAWQALDPSQRRRRILDALKSLLLRESQVQPVLLVFEDLHWIDGETQAFLDEEVESLPTARIMLLVNYRPEYRHDWGGRTTYTQCRIDPLPAASAEALLATLLGDDAGLGALKRTLTARTEGNPFFLEESVRALVETGALAGAPGAYRMTEGATPAQVPATVQGVLAARIDRLSAEDKRLLQTAAVVGKDVPYPLLQAIADLSEDALRQGLTALQAAEFLYETHLFPDLEYTFKHALTHEVAYGGLLQRRQRELHRRIAEAIETVYAARLGEQLERLAHHYTEAGLAEPAITYWRQVGQRAVERSANAEAITHLGKALELVTDLPEAADHARQELALHIALGPALIATKGWSAPDVERAYLRARELCNDVGEPAQTFTVLWGLWLSNHSRGRLSSAKTLADEVLALAENQSDPALLLQAHHAAWTTDYYFGDLVSSREHAERGLALYDIDRHRGHASIYGGHDPGVCCRDSLATALWLLGYPDQALRNNREAMSLARKLAHPFSLIHALDCATRLHQRLRDPVSTQASAEATISACTKHGIAPQYLATGIMRRGWAAAVQGRTKDGLAEIEAGLAMIRTAGEERGRAYFLVTLAEVYGQVGQPDQGLQALAEALEIVETTNEGWWEPEVHRLKGELLLLRSRKAADQAAGCFHRALEVARGQHAKSLELRAATSLARLWQRQGKPEPAREMLAPVYDWFTEGFDTADLSDAKALLDEIA